MLPKRNNIAAVRAENNRKLELRRILRRIYQVLLSGSIIVVMVVIACNVYINWYSRSFLFSSMQEVPFNEFGMVLGTSKYRPGGGYNSYFTNRVNASAALYSSGKINKLIISGDNREMNYNEPLMMKQSLVKAGVPDSILIMDSEGFETIESIKNCISKYHLQSVTIISQRFHNQRAVYLARNIQLEAVAYNAEDIGFFRDMSTHIREWGAKVKAFFETEFGK